MSHSQHHCEDGSFNEDIDSILSQYSASTPGSPKIPLSRRSSMKWPEAERHSRASSISGTESTGDNMRILTHSGYLDRAELFGRAASLDRHRYLQEHQAEVSPERSSQYRFKPTALDRVAERGRSAKSALNDRIKQGFCENANRQSSRLSRKSSRCSLRESPSLLIDDLDDNFPPMVRRRSTRSLRSSRSSLHESMPQDEWIEAGTPETTKKTVEFALETDDVYYATHDGETLLRSESPAAKVLHEQLLKCGLRPAPTDTPKSSWTRRIFGRQGTDRKKSSQKPVKDKAIAEPVGMDSIQSPFSSLKPGQRTEKFSRASVKQNFPGRHSEQANMAGLSEIPALRPSIYSTSNKMFENSNQLNTKPDDSAKHSMHGLNNFSGAQELSSVAMEASSSSLQNCGPATTLTSSRSRFTTIIPVTTFSQAPVATQQNEAFPVSVLLNDALTITIPNTIFSQAPLELQTYAPQQPYTCHLRQGRAKADRQGMTLAEGSAVVSGCVSFSAIRLALLEVGEDVSALDLFGNMCVASAIGMVFCVVVDVIGIKRLDAIPEKVLLAFVGALKAVYGVLTKTLLCIRRYLHQ